MAQLVLFNKPYGVLSQFTDKTPPGDQPRSTLSDFLSLPGFRAAGRLDFDSEGLLLLTDDGHLPQRVANPRHKQGKVYWVQVEGVPGPEALALLQSGLELKDGMTLPARVKPIPAPALWQREPPVRFRKHIPDSWLEICIREGRNRQVRRMTAAIGHPTLRLVRMAIGEWQLADLCPGDCQQITINTPTQNGARRNRRASGQYNARNDSGATQARRRRYAGRGSPHTTGQRSKDT